MGVDVFEEREHLVRSGIVYGLVNRFISGGVVEFNCVYVGERLVGRGWYSVGVTVWGHFVC
jgi:hypothetical protein